MNNFYDRLFVMPMCMQKMIEFSKRDIDVAAMKIQLGNLSEFG